MTRTPNKPKNRDETRAEYSFDYQKARPNRFAAKSGKNRTVVELDDDVVVVFSNAKTVNNALRALIAAMPSKSK
jgi:hypothetical protein